MRFCHDNLREDQQMEMYNTDFRDSIDPSLYIIER